MKEIKEIEDEMKKISGEISKLMKKQNSLEKNKIDIIIKNDMLIKDLSPYEGKCIWNISAYNKEGKDVCIPTDEIVEVKDGKLYCSSYTGGIVCWSKNQEAYVRSYYGREEILDIAGFLDIELDED